MEPPLAQTLGKIAKSERGAHASKVIKSCVILIIVHQKKRRRIYYHRLCVHLLFRTLSSPAPTLLANALWNLILNFASIVIGKSSAPPGERAKEKEKATLRVDRSRAHRLPNEITIFPIFN